MAEAPKNPVIEKPVKVKRRPIRTFFKNLVNVRRWSNYDRVKDTGKIVFGTAKEFFIREKPEIRTETFEAAIQRMNLREEDVKARKRIFYYYSILYFLFALGLLSYGIYLLINLHFLAAIGSLALMILLLVYAYRESFWYMQMQNRKLGCTYKDWVAFILRRPKI